MTISRRHFLRNTGAVTLGFTGLHTFVGCGASSQSVSESGVGYGPLKPDANNILDLPEGFSYTIVSRTGDQMDDGFFVPGTHDGMAAFTGPRNLTILVRNHEINAGAGPEHGPFGSNNQLLQRLDHSSLYDAGSNGTPCMGGTTTLVYNTNLQRLESHHLSLTGTLRNCAGGPTPWNTWITCEETVDRAGDSLSKDHGYNFEVPVTDQHGLANPVALEAMGRFNHEAIAVDPASGIIYETEDRGDSLIYRFIPNTPGQPADGGKLQALCILDSPSLDTRNWDSQEVEAGQELDVYWIDLDDVTSENDDLRIRGYEHGAARFARGEGMWYGNGSIYFACTNGGSAKKGQIWKYTPSAQEGNASESNAPGRLELFVEPNDGNLVENGDNLTIAPWGDLIVCEDGSGNQNLVGVTPEGKLYKFGHNSMNNSEFAGATFSPDGSTFFVNIQNPGFTVAITGPWKREVV
ncbi:MAG: alkaline phosphatase PhoX [Balneolales bacterium]